MIPEYTQDDTEITVKVGRQFAIVLAANPTAGYEWQPEFNSEMLQLQTQDFLPPDARSLGAQRLQRFIFAAPVAGTTELVLRYRRSWEFEPEQALHYHIRISGGGRTGG